MDKLKIIGNSEMAGSIDIPGAKNSSLPIMISSLLTNQKLHLSNLPNLNDVTLISETLGRSFKFRISAAALRTVDHRGGLDGFMSKAKPDVLSPKALKIKRDIEKAKLTKS